MNFLADSMLSIMGTSLPFSLPSGRHTNDWDCSGFLWDPHETLYLLPTPDGSTHERKRWWDEAWTPEGLSSRKHITRLCWPPGWETCLFLLLKFDIHKQKHNNSNNQNHARLWSAKSSFPDMEEHSAPPPPWPQLPWRWVSFEIPLMVNEQENERACIESRGAAPACWPPGILTVPSSTDLLVKSHHRAITWQDFQLIKNGEWPPGVWAER